MSAEFIARHEERLNEIERRVNVLENKLERMEENQMQTLRRQNYILITTILTMLSTFVVISIELLKRKNFLLWPKGRTTTSGRLAASDLRFLSYYRYPGRTSLLIGRK